MENNNNVKNCINIDFKWFIDLAWRMEFSKLFELLTQKGNTEYFKLSVSWKIPLSCFYLQLEFDNYVDNCQPQVLAEKDLVSSEFWSRFSRNLLIDWIDSSLNNSSPRNKEIFFQWKRKNKRVWSLQRRGFYTLIETNAGVTLTDMKNTNKTNLFKKEKDNCHSARRL